VSSKTIDTTEALVVGAGPVGLITALGLSERGVDVRIVDCYQRSALHSYGLALHAGSLRLLDEYGLTDTLDEHGQRLERIDVHVGNTHRATIDLTAVGGPFPYVLVIAQATLEAALEKRLSENGVEVLWRHPLLVFDDTGDSVDALIAEPIDEESTDRELTVSTSRLQASYLVGADGYDSLIRRLLSVPHEAVGPPLTYGLVEFESSTEDPGRACLSFGEQWNDVLWPLGADRARWGVQATDDSIFRDGSRLLDTVRQRASWFDTDACRVDWVSRVRFQPRLTTRFGRGRVWLAGDSAHLTAPAGVQSMNVGLREGYDLARRLAAILREARPPRLLHYYHEERQREWKMLLGVHDRLQTLAQAPDWSRDLGQRLVRALPASGHDLNSLLEQVGLRLNWLRGKAGRRRSS